MAGMHDGGACSSQEMTQGIPRLESESAKEELAEASMYTIRTPAAYTMDEKDSK